MHEREQREKHANVAVFRILHKLNYPVEQMRADASVLASVVLPVGA